MVVDRTELEGQLKKWVERLLGDMQQHDIPVWPARDKDELRDLLSTDKRGLILSMIHKFQDIEKDANTRDNIYVFIDEAHRSVAKDLGTYLMAALPASTIIGFTGTPIDRTSYGKGTFKIFGTEDEQGYLHKYSIAESIDDETTLPIRHTLAPSDMTVPVEQLDREFLTAADAEGVTTGCSTGQCICAPSSPPTTASARWPHSSSPTSCCTCACPTTAGCSRR